MSLTPHDIARMLDHSTLQPFLTEDDIRRGCELALKYDTASVCARPCDVPILAEMLRGSDVKVCTVIGFPHGAHATQIKVDEARLALDQGCEELDMVINIGEMIRGNEAYVQGEIKQICDLAHSRNAIVKVILETCYLTDAQKKRCCLWRSRALRRRKRWIWCCATLMATGCTALFSCVRNWRIIRASGRPGRISARRTLPSRPKSTSAHGATRCP